MFAHRQSSGAWAAPPTYQTDPEDHNISILPTSSLAGWDWVQPPRSISVGEFISSATTPWPDPLDPCITYPSLTPDGPPSHVQVNTSTPTPMQQPSVYNLGSMAYMYQDVASSPSPGGVNSLELTLARRPTQWGEFAASNGLALDIGEEYTRELMESLRTDSHRSGGNPFPSTPSYVLRRWAQAVKDELRLRSIVTASTDDSTAPKIMTQLETSGGPAPQKHQVYAGCPFNEGCTTPIDTFTLKGLRAHQRTYHADPNFTTCRWTVGHRYCSKMFTTTGGLIKHIGQVHLRCKAVKCPTCGETLARSDALARHRKGTCTASVPGPSGGTHING